MINLLKVSVEIMSTQNCLKLNYLVIKQLFHDENMLINASENKMKLTKLEKFHFNKLHKC